MAKLTAVILNCSLIDITLTFLGIVLLLYLHAFSDDSIMLLTCSKF